MIKNVFLLSLLLLVLGCAGPQKSLDKKNYEKAYRLAMKELDRKKSVSQNRRVLAEALSHIIDEQYTAISKLVTSNNLEDWETAIDKNRSLQQQILDASKYLGNRYERTAVDLEERELSMMVSVYDVYFQDGKSKINRALNIGDKLLAQDAYYDLTRAKSYASEPSSELNELIQTSLANGVVNYTVEIDAPFSVSYHWEIDREFDDIGEVSSLFRNVQFESNYDNADCLIEIEFDRLDIFYGERSQRENFEQRVITGYNTIVDTSGVSREEPIYENVQGAVNILQRIKTARWDIRVDVNSKSPNCDLESTYFDANIESVIEEYQLIGDQRAIPDEYKENRRQEFLPNDEMAQALIVIIYDEVINRIFN